MERGCRKCGNTFSYVPTASPTEAGQPHTQFLCQECQHWEEVGQCVERLEDMLVLYGEPGTYDYFARYIAQLKHHLALIDRRWME